MPQEETIRGTQHCHWNAKKSTYLKKHPKDWLKRKGGGKKVCGRTKSGTKEVRKSLNLKSEALAESARAAANLSWTRVSKLVLGLADLKCPSNCTWSSVQTFYATMPATQAVWFLPLSLSLSPSSFAIPSFSEGWDGFLCSSRTRRHHV